MTDTFRKVLRYVLIVGGVVGTPPVVYYGHLIYGPPTPPTSEIPKPEHHDFIFASQIQCQGQPSESVLTATRKESLHFQGEIKTSRDHWLTPQKTGKLTVPRGKKALKPKRVLEIKALMYRWVWEGERCVSQGNVELKWVDDETLSIIGSVTVPDVAGKYELRIVVSDGIAFPGQLKVYLANYHVVVKEP